MVGSLVFPPSHTQVDWRLFVEGEDAADADAAALLADVFGGGAADEPDEAAAAPACGWPRFDAALRALRDAAGEDAPAPARNEAERFAALVRILVAPRTPSDIVDAAVDALRPTTAAEFTPRRRASGGGSTTPSTPARRAAPLRGNATRRSRRSWACWTGNRAAARRCCAGPCAATSGRARGLARTRPKRSRIVVL